MVMSNISGNMHRIIFNMHNNIKSCLFYNGEKSEHLPCEIGVRQGDNLFPFLFSLFVDDLEDYFYRRNCDRSKNYLRRTRK